MPGNDEKKLSKIPSLQADCICLDCEDGVASEQKGQARKNIREILDGKYNEETLAKSVRINIE